MPSKVPDHIDECQDCGERSASEVVAAVIGGVPAGPLYVCSQCAGGEDDAA